MARPSMEYANFNRPMPDSSTILKRQKLQNQPDAVLAACFPGEQR
jgi:hypothetical protein